MLEIDIIINKTIEITECKRNICTLIDNQAVIEATTIYKPTLSQSVIVSRQSLIILISSERVQLIWDTGMQAPVNWQNMVLTDSLRRNQDEKGEKI